VLDGLKEGEVVVLSGQFLIDSEASLTGTLARLGGNEDQTSAQSKSTSEPTITAEGSIKKIDGDQWTIAADPIPALGMGAMMMTFVRPALASGDFRPGQRVRFTFSRKTDGAFEIKSVTLIEPKPSVPSPPRTPGGAT
jgi:Cu(I)/Ag(I) efflux system membrane fusion protein